MDEAESKRLCLIIGRRPSDAYAGENPITGISLVDCI